VGTKRGSEGATQDTHREREGNGRNGNGIFTVFEQLESCHFPDALVKRLSLSAEVGGSRRGHVIWFVSGRKKRVRFYTIVWSHTL
jgi:hypothetical protein